VFGNMVQGVPIDERLDYAGGFGDLVNPYALLGGLTVLALFLMHGALFATLRTSGRLGESARRFAVRAAVPAVVLAAGFLGWTQALRGEPATAVTASLAGVALLASLLLTWRGASSLAAFLLTGAGIALTTATMFLALYPAVLPSSTDPAFTLTVQNASSTTLTLQIMTWAAAIFLPLVIAYQAWTYWVFRRRITADPEDADAPAGSAVSA
jgi:cytochrome d ubiquinol oxidase subunit II